MEQRKLILIAGPTATGKSARALDLARQRHGLIINADAMQLYGGLPVLTAQPSFEEQREVPHALYGVIDPAERSSAGKWLSLAQKAIASTVESGHTPVLVGGTGLYFKALFEGLTDIPDIPGDIRDQVQKLYDEIGHDRFREQLARLDPESAARLAKNDRQRLIRAYEVVTFTKKAIGDWHKTNLGSTEAPCAVGTKNVFVCAGTTFSIEAYCHMLPREQLYAACDRRFEDMVARGAVEEVKNFLKRGLDHALPAMKTIGVRDIGAYLQGKITLDAAIAEAQQATRNYAKRQMTWFRNQWVF